jgi:hypothetical protein
MIGRDRQMVERPGPVLRPMHVRTTKHSQEMSMPTRASLLALATIATLATAALAATGASAAQFTVNHPGGHWDAHYHPYPICSWGCHRWHDHEEDEREHHSWGWNHRPIYAGPVGVASAGRAAVSARAQVPSGSAGCLTKRELPDGSALFKDLCTQEQAESQPQGGAPGAR